MPMPDHRGEDLLRGPVSRVLLLAIMFLVLATGAILASSCAVGRHGNGDGDDDSSDDDTGTGDDAGDDTGGHPCEGQYDVIVRGDYEGDFPWVATWTSKYVIQEDQTTVGIVIPDAAGWPTYDAIGVRTAPGAGYSDGNFPTPQDLGPYCDGATAAVHVEYAVDGGLFQGTATYYCPGLLGPYSIFGSVTCGTP